MFTNKQSSTNTVKPGTHWRQSRKDVRHSGDRAYRRQSRPSWRQCRPRQAVEFKLLPICRHRATRDVREWLSTYPFPPIAIYLIPIPSHAHSQVFDLFPFPWDSRGLFPFPPIPIMLMLKLYIISDTVIIIICS